LIAALRAAEQKTFPLGRGGKKKGCGENEFPPCPRFLPRSERKVFYYWGFAAAIFRAKEVGAPPISFRASSL